MASTLQPGSNLGGNPGDDPPVAIAWFRRDLRLGDNPMLVAARAAYADVIPLFVHDSALTDRASGNRLAFLDDCLDDLDAVLDGRLLERVGDPASVIVQVAKAAGAVAVYAAVDFGPYGARRDAVVASALAVAGIDLRLVGSPYAVDPGKLFTQAGTPFRVFTPFSKAWRAKGWDQPVAAPGPGGWFASGPSDPRPPRPQPEASDAVARGGEAAAWAAVEPFLEERVGGYRDDRNRPDLDSTSRLSPHLKFGTIHPRQLLAELGDDDGARTFASELCWRDFYADVLHHRPDSTRSNYVATLDDLIWDDGPVAEDRFAAWCAGRTGYPIVDAGMRQLLAEGWMHNRVRMIVGSFLVKDLHIHWTRGAAWFMRHLVDGDLASNVHGWQWVAGTGTDASPFFRVFNPTGQAQRFDPDGDYVRRYVPELRGIAGGQVHEPWAITGDLFTGGAPIYPRPIVDHAIERAEALARYKAR